MADERKRPSLVVITGIVVLGLVVVAVGTSAALFFRYVKTDPTDSSAATRAFEVARARFKGQLPLIEYRGLQTPVVNRTSSAPRHQLGTLHALIYSSSEGYIRRADVPFAIVRVTTAGGRLSLMDLGMFGDGRDRITLEDLERHGPGLVLDTRGSAVGSLAVADTLLGTRSTDSQMLIWTE